MSLISVLIAVYNGELYIKNTIQSILNQTYTNFELIIVVNCSSDSTKEILSEINDERIKIYETNICQLAFNLNYGLLKAKGEYIARIDADDIAMANRLEKQLEVLKNGNYDVVGSNLEFINEDGAVIGEKKYPEFNKTVRRNIMFASPLAHPSVMYKKSVILNVAGYMNGRVSEDYDLWLRLMRDKNIKFYNIQEKLIKYRIHAGQIKGDKLAYNEIAGYMIREALYKKSLKCFIGFCVYIMKSLLK